MQVVKKKFDNAFKEIIRIEKGYVNDKADKGGETKYGISKRSYPHLDIKNLSLSDAKKIYKKDFWKTKKGDLSLLPYSIGLEVFDTGVNSGINTARKMLQQALNLLNRVETYYLDLKVDGWIAKKTLKAIQKISTKRLLKVLNGLQFLNYHSIVEKTHSQERFFAGWMERV